MGRSITKNRPVCQREVTEDRAKLIHRAMLGDKQAWETVTVEETEDLQFRRCFPLFLEVNRDRLAIVGKVGEPV